MFVNGPTLERPWWRDVILGADAVTSFGHAWPLAANASYVRLDEPDVSRARPAAAAWTEDLDELDEAFPPPTRKKPIEMI